MAYNIAMPTVYIIINCFKATGHINRKCGSGKKQSKQTKAFIKAMREKVWRNPVQSMGKLAKEQNVLEGIIRHLIKYDLGPSSGPG